jgi:peptide/nickel transport system substrate-binding protein
MKMKSILVLVGIAICAMLLASPPIVGAQLFGDANKDDAINALDLDRVVIPIDEDFSGANAIAFGGWYGLVLRPIYEPLIKYNIRTDTYEPWLAESFEISDDAKVYTFHMVKNATWHDGVPVTSEDVNFTIEYLKSKRPTWRTSLVDHVECPDKYTAIIHLKTKNPLFLKPGPNPWGAGRIFPKHVWQNIDDPDRFKDTEFIGSGAYKFKKRILGEYFVLEANENYHGDKPHVKEVVFKVIPYKDLQVLALKSGEVDIVYDISFAIADDLEGKKNIGVYSIPETSFQCVEFNCELYPTNITEFRRALAHAVDKEKICNIAFEGCGTVVDTFLLPSIARDFVNYDTPKYEYNITKAKRILKSAGFEDRDGDGWLEGPDREDVVITTLVKELNRIIEILKADWEEELGIKVKLRFTEEQLWFEEIHKKNIHTSEFPTYGRFDPNSLRWMRTYGHFNTPNRCGWSNSEFDALAEELIDTVDREKRKEIGYRMQEILATEVPKVPICASHTLVAYRADRFIGWDSDPLYLPYDRKILLNVKPVRDNVSADTGKKVEEKAIRENESEGEGGEQKIPVNLCDLLIAIVVATSISIAMRKRR